MSSRAKMCQNKVSFRNRERADSVAKKFGQRVYECPICFCWHCTNKEDWHDEFITREELKKQIATIETRLRTEFNDKMRKKNSRITELEKQNKNLRCGRED